MRAVVGRNSLGVHAALALALAQEGLIIVDDVEGQLPPITKAKPNVTIIDENSYIAGNGKRPDGGSARECSRNIRKLMSEGMRAITTRPSRTKTANRYGKR